MIRLPTRLDRLVLLFSMLLPVGAAATEVGGLYEAVVPVSSQAASERQQVVEEGFRQVLVKISGQRSILGSAGVQAEVANAGVLLGSYRYETAMARQNGQQADAGVGVAALRLRMSFDPKGVMAAINRAGLPVWGSSRPVVYLWVGRETPAGRQIFGPASPQGTTLIDMAGVRGLPVVLTAADQLARTDVATISRPVVDAATRAGARVILSAATAGSGSRWRASGVLSVDGEVQPVEAAGVDEHAALRELVAMAADRLGARHAVAARTDSLQSVLLQVAGVGDLQGHAELTRWLRSLPLVRDLVIEGVEATRIEYRLAVAGDTEGLQHLLVSDGRLGAVLVVPGDPALPVIEARLQADTSR
ncbi:MAG: DUF2066 domain-containing protein [Gammaproteobacteria bacterium]